MISQHEVNFFNLDSKSSMYINRNEENCNWNFSEKDINSNNNNIFNIITLFIFTISLIAYII